MLPLAGVGDMVRSRRISFDVKGKQKQMISRKPHLITCSIVLLATAGGNAVAQPGGRGAREVVMPDNAAIHMDLAYADDSPRNVLDLYIPEAADTPPIVMFMHGGGFSRGDKASPRGLQELIDAGIAVASMNYRLSDTDIWPAQLHDIRNAFAFLRANGKRYGYDNERIASFGNSAGGHFSAIAAIVMAENPETKLAASVVWYPPVDFTTMDADIAATGVEPRSGRNAAPDSPESGLIGATVGENRELALAASPLTYLAALPAETQLPPMLIMHGAADPLIGRGQSGRLFYALLNHQGAQTLEYVLLPHGTHGGGDFEKPETIQRVIEFLQSHFGQ